MAHDNVIKIIHCKSVSLFNRQPRSHGRVRLGNSPVWCECPENAGDRDGWCMGANIGGCQDRDCLPGKNSALTLRDLWLKFKAWYNFSTIYVVPIGNNICNLSLPVWSITFKRSYLSAPIFCQENKFDSSVNHHVFPDEIPQFNLIILELMASKLE